MNRITGYPLYWLGTSLGALSSQLDSGLTYGKLAQQAFWAKAALEFFASDQIIPLKGSKTAAQQLIAALDKIVEPHFLQSSGSTVISSTDRDTLIGLIGFLGNVLLSELGQANTYFAAQVRAWNMTTLIDTAEMVLSESVRAALSNDERDDIREAGRCLAFSVPTGTAFHLFRLIESVVTKYFPILTITPKDSDRNLGKYIQFLEGKGIHAKIITMLKHLKDEYRNPSIHPGVFVTPEEAANLFGLCQSVVDMLIEDIKNEQAKRTSTP